MKPIIVTGIDLETTDLDVDKGAKIIEIALDVHATINGKWKRLKTLNLRCHPGLGVAINPKAQAVHGISIADLAGEPKFAEIAPTLMKVLTQTDILVAHNANFDVPFLAVEMIGAGIELPDLQVVCTMEEGRLATPMGKLPNLGELCFAFGVDYNPDEAHAADYDIVKTMDCFIAGVKSGFYQLPSLADDTLEGAA